MEINGGNEFAIFNVYMPVDTQHDRENLAVFDAVLGDILAICEAETIDRAVIGGDFNTNLNRTLSPY